jgi:hypothetical protein
MFAMDLLHVAHSADDRLDISIAIYLTFVDRLDRIHHNPTIAKRCCSKADARCQVSLLQKSVLEVTPFVVR